MRREILWKEAVLPGERIKSDNFLLRRESIVVEYPVVSSPEAIVVLMFVIEEPFDAVLNLRQFLAHCSLGGLFVYT